MKLATRLFERAVAAVVLTRHAHRTLQKRITSGETHVIQSRRLSGLAKVISITLLSANSAIPMESLQLPLELAVSNADAVAVVDILGRSPQNNYGGGNCGSLYLARVVAGFKGSNQMIEFFSVTLDLDPEKMPTRALVMAFPSPQLQLDAWIYHISLATAEETQVFTCRTRAPLFVPEFATTVWKLEQLPGRQGEWLIPLEYDNNVSWCEDERLRNSDVPFHSKELDSALVEKDGEKFVAIAWSTAKFLIERALGNYPYATRKGITLFAAPTRPDFAWGRC